MNKTKILVFIHGLGNGGAERSVVELLRYYNREIYSVKVLRNANNTTSDYMHWVRENDLFEPSQGINYGASFRNMLKTIILNKKNQKISKILIYFYFLFFLKNNINKLILKRLPKAERTINRKLFYDFFLENVQNIFRLEFSIEQYKPDILAGSLMESSNALIFFAKIDNPVIFKTLKWIVIEQNNTLTRLHDYYKGNVFLFWKLYSEIVFNSSDYIIAVSNGIKNGLVKNFNVNINKIRVINNQVNTKDVDESIPKEIIPSPSYIVSAGRYHSQKQFHILIEAFSKIQKLVDEHLVILGKGGEEDYLKNRIRDLGLTQKVHLVSFNSTPWGVFKKSSLFVLSSKYEGLPLVLLEAMRCKIPVISFDCDYGPAEIISDGINGLLVPQGDIDLLAEKMLLLIRNKELAQTLAKNGFERAQDFDSKKIAREYEIFFDSQLN
jgi:glycosyltransferase involved in cell wall biosynthesis